MKKLLHMDYTTATMPVIATYLSLSFFFSDFGLSAVLGACFLLLWTGVCFLCFIRQKQYKLRRFGTVHWLVLVFNVFVLLNILRNFSFDRTVIYYAIILTVGTALFWFSSPPTPKAIAVSKGILITVALLFAVVNIFVVCFPEQTRSILYQVISQTSVAYNERLAAEGYGFAFGEDIGFTAHVIALGLSIVWFNVNQKNLKSHIPMLLLLSFGLIAAQRRGELIVWCLAIVIISVIKWIKTHGSLSVKAQLKLFATPLLCVIFSFAVFFCAVPSSRWDYVNYTSPETTQPQTEATQTETTVVESSDGDGTPTEITQEETQTLNMDKLSNGRRVLWTLAFDAFMEKPVFGHGWHSFSEIAPLSGNTHATNVHCVYLQLLCETGIVGFVIVGTVFLWILVLIVRKITSSDGRNLSDYLLGLCILLAMLILGLVDNSLYNVYWIQAFQLMIFLVFCGREWSAKMDV